MDKVLDEKPALYEELDKRQKVIDKLIELLKAIVVDYDERVPHLPSDINQHYRLILMDSARQAIAKAPVN